MVYVQSMTGKPLMQTEDHRMVRLLLRNHKAKIIKRTPFTIRMLIPVRTCTQSVTLGIDAGSRTIGISASTDKKELLAAELYPRNDVVKLLASRRELRRIRRSRKTRYEYGKAQDESV